MSFALSTITINTCVNTNQTVLKSLQNDECQTFVATFFAVRWLFVGLLIITLIWGLLKGVRFYDFAPFQELFSRIFQRNVRRGHEFS